MSVSLETKLKASLARAGAPQAGVDITALTPVSGGDINEAYQVTFADGGYAFVKHHSRAPGGMFRAEAEGLAWLGEANAIRVPRVLAVESGGPSAGTPGVTSGATDGSSFLILEWIDRAAVKGRDSQPLAEDLGRQLANLHRYGAPTFGANIHNYIGILPQDNTPKDDWETFYRDNRLRPQLDRATASGLVPVSVRRKFDQLFLVLGDRLGPPEPPARLHGDLWSGNHMFDADGAPVLIDPAVYGGHREMDLAMMHLFGGFSARVFDAYHEAYPLDGGGGGTVAGMTAGTKTAGGRASPCINCIPCWFT